MLLFGCKLSSQHMKLSVTNICICNWDMKWFLPEIMGISLGRPADTLWTWNWRVTCLLVLLGEWVSKCLKQDNLSSLMLFFMSITSSFIRKFTTKLKAEAFQRNYEALEIFEEQYHNVKICISLPGACQMFMVCNKEICTRERRQLCRALFDVFITKLQGKESLSSNSAAEVEPDGPVEWWSNVLLSVDV